MELHPWALKNGFFFKTLGVYFTSLSTRLYFLRLSIHGAIIQVWRIIDVIHSDADVVVSYGGNRFQREHRKQKHVPSVTRRNGINQRADCEEIRF